MTQHTYIQFLKFREEAENAHMNTNQTYDSKPYSYHLRMVDDMVCYLFNETEHNLTVNDFHILRSGAYGHDLVEDARLTWNDIKKISCEEVADICAACCNYGGGKTRDERMPDWIYEKIKNTYLAPIVKLGDRMANLTYSKLKNSTMALVYMDENPKFREKMYTEKYDNFFITFDKYVNSLCN